MNTIEKFENAILQSKYNLIICTSNSGRIAFLKFCRSGGQISDQVLWLNRSPSTYNITELIELINKQGDKLTQEFIDTH